MIASIFHFFFCALGQAMRTLKEKIIVGPFSLLDTLALINVSIFTDLHITKNILVYKKYLSNKKGIYIFINLLNKKLYIAARPSQTKNFSDRFLNHIRGHKNKSNKYLQKAFTFYGKKNFAFITFELPEILLPILHELEKNYIKSFDFKKLYNIKNVVNSFTREKKTFENINKSLGRSRPGRAKLIKNYANYPKIKESISVSQKVFLTINNNPILNKLQNKNIRTKIVFNKRTPVSLYNNFHKYILRFRSGRQLAAYVECDQSTVFKYIKSGKCYKNKYYFKI
jgi:group I intron endonuclease